MCHLPSSAYQPGLIWTVDRSIGHFRLRDGYDLTTHSGSLLERPPRSRDTFHGIGSSRLRAARVVTGRQVGSPGGGDASETAWLHDHPTSRVAGGAETSGAVVEGDATKTTPSFRGTTTQNPLKYYFNVAYF